MKSRFLDQSELTKLREIMSTEEFLPLWLSLETGLRVGDVVSLKRSALKRDGVHYVAQKTGKRGVAQISSNLRSKLGGGSGYLFPSPYKVGQHLTRQAVWQRIKRAGHRAGVNLDGLSPHSMRKIFAVELYRAHGFEAVRAALQHKYSSTSEIYAFADWDTGENAELPLKRKDLKLVVRMCLEALSNSPPSKKKEGG